jgi:exo-beta-1,3-glucanase (GH17 family)
LLAASVPTGPVLGALSDCRNWITYSPSQPYNPGNLAALTEAHITADLNQLYDAGFRGLVTYTLDGAFREAPRIAKQIGFTQVIAGAYWYNDAQLAVEKQAALEELAYIDAFIVGNEGLAGGVCQEANGRQCYTRQRLEEEIAWFRTNTWKPVSTTETGYQALTIDPTLLDLGDFSTVNIQPWFNPNLDPGDPAGMAQAVSNEYLALQNLRPDRTIFIKETWYSAGGHPAASEANQSAFFAALAQNPTVKFVWGEAYDQPWKSESSPFGTIGPHWGLFTTDGTPKAVINDLKEIYTGSYNRVEDVLGRALVVLQRMNDPTVTGGLPVNEATAAELDALGQGTVPQGQTHWVPGQVAFGMLAQVGSHAYRRQQPDFTRGLSDSALYATLNATIGKLETIFGDSSRIYTDSVTQGKALYQRYGTLTAQPLFRDTFENAVPLIDNAEVFAALRASSNYLRGLTAADLDGTVSPTQFTALATRMDAISAQFDFRMWFDGTNLRIGGGTPLGTPPTPATGGSFDRIASETRLAAVAALANRDVTPSEFNAIVTRAIGNSKIGSSPQGSLVERVPYDGTALELVGATPLLARELGTQFGHGTLLASVAAYRDVADGIGGGLPAFGATGVSDGTGDFRRLALAPSENSLNPDRNRAVLVTVAAGMLAGALGKPPVAGLQALGDHAVENLEDAIDAAETAGKYHTAYGLPNAVDQGAGVIGPTSVWGYLEVAELATSLLQYKLGGDFYEKLLRGTAGWRDALNAYWLLLNDREMEAVAQDAPGVSACRSNASGGILNGTLLAGQARDCANTWHIETVGEVLAYPLPITITGRYAVAVTYSNDDLGVGDTIELRIDGHIVSSFHAEDTNSWSTFTSVAAIDLGKLQPGLHDLSFRLADTDGYGIDFDKYALSLTAVDWKNPGLPFDVNNDGRITPLDVLLVINYINANPGNSGRPPVVPNAPPPFYDVDGTDTVLPLDVLLIINFINSQGTGGEGEPATSHDVQPDAIAMPPLQHVTRLTEAKPRRATTIEPPRALSHATNAAVIRRRPLSQDDWEATLTLLAQDAALDLPDPSEVDRLFSRW